MTSLLILSAFAAGIIIGKRHKPELPLTATHIQFIKQLPGSRHVERCEFTHNWLERDR
ncbi:hypothetical protein [Mesorhizobium sp. M1A.F.Ca.IN.022.02.1.1]|uniref:hypothetical protein n=1 Tax=Mesorhizobium sp. M1A.F.Ca.IN.022.02.1.1 TaxID=2496766 RepID=UPI0013E040EF|nr:hypothetical protein [Mesorhizobium sp. M1A.F.Ca.IN.022.02.1.1]